jgi:hypothetical protein
MVVLLALGLLLNGPAEPQLTVHLSIDQDGRLSAPQLQLAMDEVRKIWSDAGVVVTSGRYGEPPRRVANAANADSSRRSTDGAVAEATISLRILLTPPPVKEGAERILAWVTPSGAGRTAPLLFVSLPAVIETVWGAEAYALPVSKLTDALRERLVAQALGRVVAHELGHYLLQHARHQNQGLMRRRYSANELVGDWLEPFKVPRARRTVVRQEIRALARFQAVAEE